MLFCWVCSKARLQPPMLNSSAEDKYASKPGREDSTEKKKRNSTKYYKYIYM